MLAFMYLPKCEHCAKFDREMFKPVAKTVRSPCPLLPQAPGAQSHPDCQTEVCGVYVRLLFVGWQFVGRDSVRLPSLWRTG